MPLTKQDIKDICALVTQLINQRPDPIGLSGRVITGSYRPGDGTHEVIIGDSDAASDLARALGDPEFTQPLVQPRTPVATHDPNDQYGPRGGEAVVILPWEGGWVAKFIADAGTNDAPGPGPCFSVRAPAGERWIFHRNDTGELDSGMQLTNDGPAQGDGLGGTVLGHKGALTQAQTVSGHQFRLDDTAQTISATTAGGMTDVFNDVTQAITRTAAPGLYTIVDGAGNAISHVVPNGGGVGIGKLFSEMGSGSGTINNDILSAFGGNINSANLQTLLNLGAAMVSAGIPNASALLPLIVASLIQNVDVPEGSAIVRVAS